MPREISLRNRLRRAGVKRLPSAEKCLSFTCFQEWVKQEDFWNDLQNLPQVDQVLLVLADLGEAQEETATASEAAAFLRRLQEDSPARLRLFRLWGSSKFIADYTRAHLPELLTEQSLLSTLMAESPLPTRTEIWAEFVQALQITALASGNEPGQTEPAQSPTKTIKNYGASQDESRQTADKATNRQVEAGSKVLGVAESTEVAAASPLPQVDPFSYQVDPFPYQGDSFPYEGEPFSYLGDYLAAAPTDTDQLRRCYYQLAIRIFSQDINSADPAAQIPQVTQALSDLAAAAISAALALAKRELDPEGKVDFSVIALGKCGAQELNYCSDVDLIYVGEAAPDANAGENPLNEKEALALAAKLAGRIQEICYSSQGNYPPLWPIDTALRPEGKDGALVRSVESYLNYYRKWAKNWEFQALLKARPIAGSRHLGEKWFQAVYPLVWEPRENFVAQAQSMRERVEDNIPRDQLPLHLKLGAGGLRDIEFSIQLLQLVHGRLDNRLRVKSTLEAIKVLAEHGYIGRQSGSSLAQAYCFLRLLEHRRQTERFKRTHLLPNTAAEWERLSRSIPENYQQQLSQAYQLGTARLEKLTGKIRSSIRRLQQDIFYRPLLSAIANLSNADASLSKEAALERLQSFGYLDPRGALGHIAALTQGLSRRATIQKHILPVLLEWISFGPNPDAGLLRFRQLSEAIGDSHWYMGLLRDSAVVAQRLCLVLSTSSYISARLEHVPQAVQWLESSQAVQALPEETLEDELRALVKRHPQSREAIMRLRAVRGRELLRQALADVLTQMDIDTSLQAISRLNLSTLKIAAQALSRDYPELGAVAFVVLGRAGGKESTYASDLDIVVLFENTNVQDAAEQSSQALSFATQLRELLQAPDISPALVLDYDLRPEGREGVLARSLDSFVTYYERWAETWEYQALMRAQVLALPGQEAFAEQVQTEIRRLLLAREFSQKHLREIRQLKARMERERISGGKDKTLQVKLGPGGLADVEWVAQVLQLQHAQSHPELLTPSTREALAKAKELGLLSPSQQEDLLSAWNLASRIRNANVLITNRLRGAKLDFLPQDLATTKAMARLLGYPPGQEPELVEDWLRCSRRARKIMEEIFYT